MFNSTTSLPDWWIDSFAPQQKGPARKFSAAVGIWASAGRGGAPPPPRPTLTRSNHDANQSSLPRPS
jgi:hypothetical protein